MTNKIIYTILSAVLIIQACDDKINPTLELAPEAFVVDAWLTNLPGEQVIWLTKSQPYFDDSTPPGALGATVTVWGNDGSVFNFIDQGDGSYTWNPPVGDTFGSIGTDYDLSILFEGETFTAVSSMGRVPTVDSITFEFEEADAFSPDSYIAEFWARDPEGTGDTYWIKAYKNGQFLSKPGEINIAYDAGFSRGGALDDLIFIPPIRDAINPFDEDEENDGQFLSPYVDGDSVYVEIHSITEASFDFLTQVAVQTDRPGGFAELFAQPLSNVPTNIEKQDLTSETIVLGFFNVAAVEGNGKKLVESEVPKED